MKRRNIYLACPIYPPTEKELESTYYVYRLQDKATSISSPRCEVMVSSSGYRIDGTLLREFPSVKLLANFGTGVELIDLDYCFDHNIAVSHTPGVLTEDIPAQLQSLDNVVLQPHLGSATDRTRRKMGNLTLDNIAAYFAGRPLITPAPRKLQ